jgi:preprotein translocase subunit SecF
MTIPSLPEEQPQASVVDEPEEMPSAIPQSVMTAVSVIMVLALILGSASAIVAWTDVGLNGGVVASLVIALGLILLWMRMPARGSRR